MSAATFFTVGSGAEGHRSGAQVDGKARPSVSPPLSPTISSLSTASSSERQSMETPLAQSEQPEQRHDPPSLFVFGSQADVPATAGVSTYASADGAGMFHFGSAAKQEASAPFFEFGKPGPLDKQLPGQGPFPFGGQGGQPPLFAPASSTTHHQPPEEHQNSPSDLSGLFSAPSTLPSKQASKHGRRRPGVTAAVPSVGGIAFGSNTSTASTAGGTGFGATPTSTLFGSGGALGTPESDPHASVPNAGATTQEWSGSAPVVGTASSTHRGPGRIRKLRSSCRHRVVQDTDPSKDRGLVAKAEGELEAGQHADAIRSCMQELANALQGGAEAPRQALAMVETVLDRWGQAERKQVNSFENEKRSIVSQLNRVTEKCESLTAMKETKERQMQELNRELVRERLQRHHLDELAEERLQMVIELEQRLRRAEEASRRQRNVQPSRQDIVRTLARLECEPLRAIDEAGRAAMKKKILLKWHPDKQPSSAHSGLATQVMQELQNRNEWSW